MKKKVLIIAVIMLFVIFIGQAIYYFFIPLNPRIDLTFDNGIITAKDLYNEVIKSIENSKCFSNVNLHIGSIDMHLNNNQKGKIEMIFVEKNKERPKIYEIDLYTDKIAKNEIKFLGKDNKLNPGNINFDNWIIDSDEAIQIAIKNFEDQQNFIYDNIWVSSCNIYKENMETWDVNLYNYSDRITYVTRIDPYTGKILSDYIYNWLD